MRCLRSARFNMLADVVHIEGETAPSETEAGHWEEQQDPITFEIIRVWVPDDSDEETPEVTYHASIPCIARGYVGTGLQGGGTGESFGELYEAVDTIRIWFPPYFRLTKRDQITNVRGPDGKVIWNEEELDGGPTIFSVMGVTPLIDPFGKHVESYALCERSEVQ
jgi:hypothetical protein